MRSLKQLFAAASIAVCFSAPSSAAVINLDTLVGWDRQFQVGTAPFFYNNTYTTTVGTKVKVTDFSVWGDEYKYYIDNVLIGTILAPGTGASFQYDPDIAFESGLFASAVFWLGAGEVLSFQAITLPKGVPDGSIAVTAVTAVTTVPEPASLALLGLGLAGLGVMRRRKQ